MKLWPYQVEAVEAARNVLRCGKKRFIIQASCGAGKTIVASEIISSAIGKGNKVLFICHFRQLAYQAMERFEKYGMADKVGFIMAGEQSDLDLPVQIASIQTYQRRLNLDDITYNRWFVDADIVIYDECHSSISRTRKAVLDIYKDRVIIGLTATPCRSDGRGLGVVYQEIVRCSNFAELQEQGYLVPVRYFGAEHEPDLDDIRLVAGDYNKKTLGERVDKPKLVGDILLNWSKIAPDRQTVIFATNVSHSLNIKEEFEKHGYSIEHIDAKTPHEERMDILRRFEQGDIQIVTNCEVFSEGADFPWVSCIILAKPSKSYARYVQKAGRVSRLYKGKIDGIIIDHARMIQEHGYLEDPVVWSLNDKEKAWSNPARDIKLKKMAKCRICHEIFNGLKACPRCGTELKAFGREIKTTDQELVELKAKKKRNRGMDWVDKRIFYGTLLYHAKEKGYKKGWAAHGYKSLMGVYPNDSRVKDVEPIKPEGKFQNLLKHILIKKAKSYQKRVAT